MTEPDGTVAPTPLPTSAVADAPAPQPADAGSDRVPALAWVIGAIFVAVELRRAHPLLDPRVFALPRLRAGALGVVAAFGGSFAMFYVNAQYLTVVHGYSLLRAGCAIAPIAVAMTVGSRSSTGLTRRLGARRVIGLGFAAQVAGLVAFSLVGPGTPYLGYILCPALALAGVGLALPPLSGAIMSSLPLERAGAGSGINGAAREVGSALGVAAMGTALGGNVAGHARSAAALTGSMDAGFRAVALAVAVAAVLVVRWSGSTGS